MISSLLTLVLGFKALDSCNNRDIILRAVTIDITYHNYYVAIAFSILGESKIFEGNFTFNSSKITLEPQLEPWTATTPISYSYI